MTRTTQYSDYFDRDLEAILPNEAQGIVDIIRVVYGRRNIENI